MNAEPAPDLQRAKPAGLSTLFDAASTMAQPLSEGELGAVLKHQLSTAVQFDLRSLGRARAARLNALASAQGLVLTSFDDLFRHPNPPIDLLVMTKDFAKRLTKHPASALPKDVALVVYYCAIAAGLVRLNKRITELSDSVLKEGFVWARNRSWITDDVRTLLTQALETME